MKKALLLLFFCLITDTVLAQISAKLMRDFDVSQSHITFVYGGDIWVVNKDGGTAYQVTSSPGEEERPKFSPDGEFIAYTASYNGNRDVYVMPVMGGVPDRITYQSHSDRLIDWHPDGDHLLFASRRHMGQRSSQKFYLVHKTGGFPEQLPLPYGELASFSPNGDQLAYITKITENYPFKRYKGGLASDILIYDMERNEVRKVTDNEFNDGKPAWFGDKVYFLSDQGPNFRLNIWEYNTTDESMNQVTDFDEFDISFLSAGPEDLVFEMGGDLYLMDLETQDITEVDVDVVSDLALEIPRREDVSGNITNMTASPGSKRVVFEARGELFNVPVSDGYSENLTRSSGAFDRHPTWSPDGESVAFWSDREGEYNIYLRSMSGDADVTQLTDRENGYGYKLYWSPNSEQIAFIDETNTIYTVDIENGDITEAGNTNWNVGHGGRDGYPIAWSPDSRWLTFTRGLENAQYAVMLYDSENEELHQATSGYYSDSNPVFSKDGKYLIYATNREFDSVYSDMDNTWVYPNSTQLVAVSLTDDIPSLLPVKNDSVEMKSPDEESDSESEDSSSEENEESESESESESDSDTDTEIQLDSF